MASDRLGRVGPGVATGAVAGIALLAVASGRAMAHAGSLGGAMQSVPVPFWLLTLTGGGIIGASFLFTSFVTDREVIEAVAHGHLDSGVPSGLSRLTRLLGGLLGVASLLAVAVVGVVGPQEGVQNLAILLVWVGWWAGLVMATYLVGNVWPALDPWRAIAGFLGEAGRELPEGADPWVAVGGLLAIVYVEVVTPLAESALLLAAAALGYTALTLAGAIAFGAEDWFDRVDPINRVFRLYGAVAPVQRTDDGLEVGLPGAAIASGRVGAEPAVVVALLWATTFDGLVATPAWTPLADLLVGVGIPALLVYLLALLVGYWLFLLAYRKAANTARRTASTYRNPASIGRLFAATLLPIAAGYHFAHFAAYLWRLLPALLAAIGAPMNPPAVPLGSVPGWVGTLELVAVVLGHVLAVWVAHSIAFDRFAGRLQPIRSQYPFVVVMVGYTMVSMWIVAQPFVEPPYV